MKTVETRKWAIFAALFSLIPARSLSQGLFMQAAAKADKAVAAYKEVWDSFYGNLPKLLDANADKTKMVFDAEHGIASFPVVLSVNETGFAEYERNATAIIERDLKPASLLANPDAVSKQDMNRAKSVARLVCGVELPFGENIDKEIEKLHEDGKLVIPRTGVIVELLDGEGNCVNHAAAPIHLFAHDAVRGVDHNHDANLPLVRLSRMNQFKINDQPAEIGWSPRGVSSGGRTEPIREESVATFSFAGITRRDLDRVADIKCVVLSDPEWTAECRRLGREKIERESALFAEKGIASKVFMLPGGVPLAINRTPDGVWVGRYEVTQDQWMSLMGKNPSVEESSRWQDRNGNSWTRRQKSHEAWGFDCPDFPVDFVSYWDVKTFLKQLNALPEVKAAGFKFRIPNGFVFHPDYRNEPENHWNHGRPEWNEAALGGADLVSDLGWSWDGNSPVEQEIAWFDTKEQKYLQSQPYLLHAVGTRRPNAYGLYDMLGNVAEMVDENGSHGLAADWCCFLGGQAKKSPISLKDHDERQRKDGTGFLGFRLFADQTGAANDSSSPATSIPIEKKMERTGLQYKTNDKGDFFCTVLVPNVTIDQLVIVEKNTEKCLDAEIRNVWSVAVRQPKRPVSIGEMNRLLSDSGGSLPGHWAMLKPEKDGSDWVLLYSVKIAANATVNELKSAVDACAAVASRIGNEIARRGSN